MRLSSTYQDISYALLRIVTGFLFLVHGSQKLFNFPVEFTYDLNPLIVSAGVIELLGGLLVMIGLFTRFSAFICSGTMAVAYWMAHASQSIFPIANGGEVATLFCFIFLYVSTYGAGVWSVQNYLKKS